MLYVCYMFSKHITCRKASGYRGLRPVMLYGYMFLRNSFLFNTKVLHTGCKVLGSKGQALSSVGRRYGLRGAWRYLPSPLGISPIPPWQYPAWPTGDIGVPL